jgi:hypothetical protein
MSTRSEERNHGGGEEQYSKTRQKHRYEKKGGMYLQLDMPVRI